MKNVMVEGIVWHKDYVKEYMNIQMGRMPRQKPHTAIVQVEDGLDGRRLREAVMRALQWQYGEMPNGYWKARYQDEDAKRR